MTSANCTMRDKNCVRLPLLSGPLSILIWMRLVFAFSCSSIAFHLASSVSTMKSLVLYELPKVMCSAALSSSTIPHGIYFSSHPRSWSLAWLSPRVTPPRENSPIFTVALQSILQRLTPSDARAWASFFYILKDRISLFDLLLRLGFHHPAQAIAQAIEHLGHRTGRGQLRLAIPLFSQRLQGRLSREAGIGQTGAKCRILLRMGIGKLTKRLGGLWLLLFPAFAATESRLSPQTDDPASALGQTTRYGLAPPPKDSFRHQGVALTIFQRHRSLKRSPFGASQFG